jgi:2-methylcitrate dehydratase PrpD
MLVDGQVGPQQTSENRLKDPSVRDLARKVTISVNPEFDEFCRLHAKGDPKGGFFGRVHMVLTDGRKLTSSVQEAGLSFTDHGWNREKMTDKFRWLTTGLISDKDVDSLVETAWDVYQLTSLDELVRFIR